MNATKEKEIIMWVITIKNKPAPLDKIKKAEKKTSGWSEDDDCYISAPTKKAAIELYLYHFGFTWRERAKGVDCKRVTVV